MLHAAWLYAERTGQLTVEERAEEMTFGFLYIHDLTFQGRERDNSEQHCLLSVGSHLNGMNTLGYSQIVMIEQPDVGWV